MSKSQPKFSLNNRRALIITGVAALLLIAAVYTYPAIISMHKAYVQHRADDARRDRITAIYDSLGLNGDYVVTDREIFGDKRIYEWDHSRTYSSSAQYIRDADVSTTADELRTAIEKAGFIYFEEPYPGSSYKQLHFKSAKGEYVRLTVTSKARDDAFQKDENTTIDPNQGPSNVTIKVNLDDNNE